jgi:hypothetical protein
MPVNEAAEMDEKLVREARVGVGPVLLNCVWPPVLSEESLQDLKRAKVENPMLYHYRKRLEQSRYYYEKLKERVPERQVLELPLQYQNRAPLRVAEAMSETLRALLMRVTS